MLGAIHTAFDLIEQAEGVKLAMHTIPPEAPEVYDLLCAADTVGVFQVESRAQMATLPRLRPREFYDLVIEVALIRPGPIQGGSVHPYIERSRGREPVVYDHELLRPALERTKGVPLFQEQMMRIAMDAAGFTPSQADQLRRAMGSKRSPERMAALKDALMAGMAERGVDAPARERIWVQLQGFADFGFPESHSFSFALIVYVSAWLKVFHPAAFYAGILANQPMGF
jgi:error-prone DNA polymerase